MSRYAGRPPGVKVDGKGVMLCDCDKTRQREYQTNEVRKTYGIYPSIVTLFTILTKLPGRFTDIDDSLVQVEQNDTAVIPRTVHLFQQYSRVSNPSDLSDDAVVERKPSFPCELQRRMVQRSRLRVSGVHRLSS